MSIFDFGREDWTKDKPRPAHLSLDGLPKEFMNMGDSTPVRIKNLNFEEINKNLEKLK